LRVTLDLTSERLRGARLQRIIVTSATGSSGHAWHACRDLDEADDHHAPAGQFDWVQDMTACWVRILGATGAGRTPLDEAVQEISAIGGAPAKERFGLKRRAAAPAEAPAITVLSRQVIAGVLISDLLLDRLCVATGQAREQVLRELSGDVPQQLRDEQLRALQAELSVSCALLRDPERASYAGLGTRIEQLLGLAEQQASELIDAARAEAAKITSSARPSQPGPPPEAN
jgi:hypothetical protein